MIGMPSETPGLRSAVEELAWILLDLLGADQMLVYCAGLQAEVLDPILVLGAFSRQEKQAFWSTPLNLTTDVLAGDLAARRMPLVLADEAARRRYQASILSELRARSLLAYPLANHAELLGMVLFGWFEEGHAITHSQEQLARAVVRSLALALENTRLYERASLQLQQALSVQEITQAILRKVDLQEVLQLIGQAAMRSLAVKGCTVRLADEHGRLQVALQEGRSPTRTLPQNWPPEHPPRGSDVALYNLGTQGNERTLLVIPLVSAETVIGTLELYQRHAAFSAQEVETARSFAGQAAIAIEHARLYDEVQKTAVAAERARLARDLHDSVSQALYAMTLYARAAQKQLAAGRIEAVERHLDDLSQTSRGALGEMRLLIFELRPPMLTALGLAGAIEHRLKSVEERSGIVVETRVQNLPHLPGRVEENLYRVVQEALNNVIKHAGASRMCLCLTGAADGLRLVIEDDGVGFDPQAVGDGGFGLKTMRERVESLAGRLVVKSQPGAGTQIEVEVPYDGNTNPVGG